jgi:predicted RNA-binding Zn ribbon-like protein
MTAFSSGSGLIGGHVALDFLNTVSWRLDPRRTVDRVPDFPALVDWARHAGLVDAAAARRLRRAASADPTAAGRALRKARRLRETLHEVLTASLGGDAPDLPALAPFLVDAVRHASLGHSLPLRWSVVPGVPGDVPRRLALAALELLRDPGALSALRCCEGAGCGWLFIDRSRSRTRRWCVAGDCGNRERVRRHYARTSGRARTLPGRP